MATPTTTTDLVTLLADASPLDWAEDGPFGSVRLDAEKIRTIMAAASAAHLHPSVTLVPLDGRTVLVDDLHNPALTGKTVRVRFILPRSENLLFVRNVTDLVRSWKSAAWGNRPEHVYLCDPKVWLAATETEQTVVAYYRILEVVGILKALAFFANETRNDCVMYFNGTRLLRLPVLYNLVTAWRLDRLNAFAQFAAAGDHRIERTKIIATVLETTLGNVDEVDRFATLLQKFDTFVENVLAAYATYVSGFSIEALRDEIEARKTEYTSRLNAVFAGIQNELLAIPASVVVASTQFVRTDEFSIVNTGLIIGSAVFTVFTAFLVFNQLHTLQSIHSEVDHHVQTIEKNHADIAKTLMHPFATLEIRYRHQRNLLGFVLAVALSGYLMVVGMYLFSSGFATDWINAPLCATRNSHVEIHPRQHPMSIPQNSRNQNQTSSISPLSHLPVTGITTTNAPNP